MQQPGVEPRPLKTMNGNSQFCEVFLDGARARAVDAIGGVGNGWKVASTMLGHERKMAASGTSRSLITVNAGPLGGNLDRTVGEIVAEARARAKTKPAAMVNSARTLIALAKEFGVNDDPVLRDELAHFFIRSEVYRLTKGSGPTSFDEAQGRPSIEGGEIDVVSEEPLKRELADFVEAIVESRAPRVTGEAGRRALALAQEITDKITTEMQPLRHQGT